MKKVCLLGDMGVGKTSLIRRYVHDTFSDDYIATIGTKTSKKTVDITHLGKEIEMTMMIWDILGQHEYKRIQKRAFQGTHGILMVVDLTRQETAGSVDDYWTPGVQEIAGEVPVVIVANKSDLTQERTVDESALKALGESYSCKPIMTSAKTGQGVEEAFRTLAKAVASPEDHRWNSSEAEQDAVTIPDVFDEIMDHFIVQIGQDHDVAMSMIRTQMDRANIDITDLKKKDINPFIKGLYDIEVDLLGVERAMKNSTERRLMARRVGN